MRPQDLLSTPPALLFTLPTNEIKRDLPGYLRGAHVWLQLLHDALNYGHL